MKLAEPVETWSERFEREFEAVTRLFRRRPVLALLFIGAIAFYGWHQIFKPKPIGSSTGLTGTTAWIYVGTMIDNQWQKSQVDGREPPLTLEVSGLPVRGATYRVIRGVNLREAAPTPRTDGSRPPMTNTKGTVGIGSILKVDDVTKVELKDTEQRTWIWAHITVVEAK